MPRNFLRSHKGAGINPFCPFNPTHKELHTQSLHALRHKLLSPSHPERGTWNRRSFLPIYCKVEGHAPSRALSRWPEMAETRPTFPWGPGMTNQRFGFPALAERVFAQMGHFKCGPWDRVHHNVVENGVLELEMSYRHDHLVPGPDWDPHTEPCPYWPLLPMCFKHVGRGRGGAPT